VSAPLKTAASEAIAFLEGLEGMPVRATADLADLRGRLRRPLAAEGVPAEQVLLELVADVRGGLNASAGGRFFGWVIGSSVTAAVGADWLAAAWDQNAASYSTAPAAAVVEEVVGEWLKSILGLPPSASFALVTGCQMAHVTCLAAARHALLAQRGWNVETQGLFSAPAIRVISGGHRHGSIDRALRLLGIGTNQMAELPTASDGRLDAGLLESALAASPDAPTVVVLQAGDLNIGAFDSFSELIPIAKKYGAWVHVDGAFGLWAAASPRLRPRMSGASMADSWATDGHKWLNVPYDCGYAFVADGAAHRSAMATRVNYISYSSDVRDEGDWNPEWSRRARGFPTYAAIRQLGRGGIAGLVENCCDHAHALVTGIGRLDGAEVLFMPTLNQGLVRFIDRRAGAGPADHDRRTDAIVEAICAGGEALFSGTMWQGRRAMRVSVCSWRTTASDVERTVSCIARALEEDAPGPSG
jgi:glutamate/tyrosine decarboxylase-like PLP-dependent enzyme